MEGERGPGTYEKRGHMNLGERWLRTTRQGGGNNVHVKAEFVLRQEVGESEEKKNHPILSSSKE